MTDEQKAINKEKDRLRMKKMWDNQTEAEKDNEREKKRLVMKNIRDKLNETEKDERNEKARLGMIEFRADRETSEEKYLRLEKERDRKKRDNDDMSDDEIEDFKTIKRNSMRKSRKEQNEEIKEYQKIENKHNRRQARKDLSTDRKREENEISKEGMRQLRSHGRLVSFIERGKQNNNELYDYKKYFESSEENAELLASLRPDIMSKINEEIRKEKEEIREIQERRKLEDFLSRENHENEELRPTELEKLEVTKIKKKIFEKEEMRKLKYDLLTEKEKEELRKKNICLGLKEHVAWIKKLNMEKVKEKNESQKMGDEKDDAHEKGVINKKIVKVTYS